MDALTAMKQALEALERAHSEGITVIDEIDSLCAAIEEAERKKPEQHFRYKFLDRAALDAWITSNVTKQPTLRQKPVGEIIDWHDRATKLEAEKNALSERLYRISIGLPQFATVSCSQCGREFGPANHGFSSCKEHTKTKVGADDTANSADVPEAEISEAEYNEMMKAEMRRAEFDAEMRLDTFGPVHG